MTSFDTEWFGDCGNTWHEEQKQMVYAVRMGLCASWGGAHPPEYAIGERSILDIGGGPVSLLLKCTHRGRCVVVDPGNFPPWVFARYEQCGIGFWHGRAEDIDDELLRFDEAWIYNTLQHVDDPELVIKRALQHAHTIRIFEWIDVDPYDGHPHRLDRDLLDQWLGAPGFATELNQAGCVGRAYYSVVRSSA